MVEKIVIASRNPDKISEIREMCEELNIQVKSALDFPHLQEVEEDAGTLEGNALKKARYVFEQTGIPALSDDTGLEVHALGGAPGVYSARYAGDKATYQDNVDKLLREIQTKEDRRAQFRTVAAFVTQTDEYHLFEGISEGTIIDERRGKNGFGYDPVFYSNEFSKTYAEMEPEEKHKISHRGRAIKKFIDFLASQQS